MRRRTKILLAIGLIAAALWAGNTSLFSCPATKPQVIAHRGLGQTYHRERLQNDTCTAERIYPPEHSLLENTIAGFGAAFEAGADIVEFDVHPTTDGKFAVFHDWTLDCRTEASGVTREKSMAELKTLDIGYGYTADGGKTFPFRGKGVGLMPSLDEVLAAFPDKRFLINIKSNDVSEGERLAAAIGALPAAQRELVMVYGGGRAVEEYKRRLPDATVLGTDGAIRCLLGYWALGWSGYMPAECRNTLFMLPNNFGLFTWGYPHRLAERAKAAGSTLVVLGDNHGERYTAGVDDLATLAKLPEKLDGVIWTNRADLIGAALRAGP
jgi:glycerophosphoryl diester phosphodiesterase